MQFIISYKNLLIFYKYYNIVFMDEHTKEKLRSVGAVAVLVIAILTIFFIFSYQREKKDMSMKLRLFFSDMTQTLQFSMNSNGAPGEWGWRAGHKNYNLIMNNIASNLRLSQNCLDSTGACFIDEEYKNFKGRSTGVNLSSLPSIILQNGIAIAMNAVSACKRDGQTCAFLYVDLNGKEKPNVFGKDLFVFMIVNSSATAFIPYNMSLNINTLINDEKFGCNKNSKIPMYCSAVLYTKNWSIDSKYPW